MIGGHTIYSGDIPVSGPTSGAVQFGFRENHAGAPVAAEGTWIDTIQIGPPNVGVTGWEVLTD